MRGAIEALEVKDTMEGCGSRALDERDKEQMLLMTEKSSLDDAAARFDVDQLLMVDHDPGMLFGEASKKAHGV